MPIEPSLFHFSAKPVPAQKCEQKLPSRTKTCNWKYPIRLIAILLLGIIICSILPVEGAEPISTENLRIILRAHKEWLESKGRKGKRAYLNQPNLQGANLVEANLSWAHLEGANLKGANLVRANLQKANLDKANLRGAHLEGANLKEAYLEGANLERVIFEPESGKLPNIEEIALARNISRITFANNPRALLAMREAFGKGGYRDLEREVAYAIMRRKTEKLWQDEGLMGKIESTFKWLLFDLTSQYGMSPGRPFRILGILLLFFSIPYMVAVQGIGRAGIWAVNLPGRVNQSKESPNRMRVTKDFLTRESRLANWMLIRRLLSVRILGSLFYGFYILRFGLFFSLLSAFRIGWGRKNLGNWISRIRSREYSFRATGWARTFSGFQTLVSGYLLVLWVLTYWGQPF